MSRFRAKVLRGGRSKLGANSGDGSTWRMWLPESFLFRVLLLVLI